MKTKDYKWFYQKYITEGLTCSQIASLCKKHERTIHSWLVKLNIPRRKPGWRCMPDSQKEKLRQWAKANPWINEQNKGKRASPLARAKMSLSRRGANAHNWNGGIRKSTLGYVYIYAPNHPNSSCNKVINRSHVVMEKSLGRYLGPEEVVHHINGVRDDDRLENLLLMDRAEHLRFHAQLREWFNAQKKLALKKTQTNKPHLPKTEGKE